jgi:hypothetical protein
MKLPTNCWIIPLPKRSIPIHPVLATVLSIRHTCKSEASQRCVPDFPYRQPTKCCFWGCHGHYSNSIRWICKEWSQHKTLHCPCSFPMRRSGKCASQWMNIGTIRANLRESLAKKNSHCTKYGTCTVTVIILITHSWDVKTRVPEWNDPYQPYFFSGPDLSRSQPCAGTLDPHDMQHQELEFGWAVSTILTMANMTQSVPCGGPYQHCFVSDWLCKDHILT